MPSSGNGITGSALPRSNSFCTIFRVSAENLFFIQRGASVVDYLLQRRLESELEAVRALPADEKSTRLHLVRGVVDGGRFNARFAKCKPKFGQVGTLVGLPSRRLEQDCGRYAAVNVPQRTSCVGIQRTGVAVLTRDVSFYGALSSRLSPSCPSTAARKVCDSSGAEPRVISGSFRAFVYESL